jgi:hypothetical protein
MTSDTNMSDTERADRLDWIDVAPAMAFYEHAPVRLRQDGVSYGKVAALIRLAVFLLPITGLPGIGALGELKGSASVYVLLVAILLAGATNSLRQTAIPHALLVFFGCLVGWIAITTAINMETIASSSYPERSALSKVFTSSLVIAFGTLVTIISLQAFRTVDDIERVFVKPLVAAVVACGLFAIPEIWSWFSPEGETAYQWTTALLHADEEEFARIPGRLVSLAFEAPDLSYFCGMTLPWLLLAYRLSPRHQRAFAGRLPAMLPLLLCLALILLSNSRTGLLMLVGVIGMECVYWIGLRRMRLPPTAVAVAVLFGWLTGSGAILWFTVANWGNDYLVDVSTTSRLAILLSQLSILWTNPVFGVGLGQYGFHAGMHLPSWAWGSYEIVEWFQKLQHLPPSFNVIGRIGAELGLPGLVIWYGFWSWAMLRIIRSAASPTDWRALALNAAMLGSIGSLLMGGISSDAFRRPETWMLIAILTLHAGRTAGSAAETTNRR